MKTGLANLNFLCNFSQLLQSNISLLIVLFTAYVGVFRFFSLLSGKGYVFKWTDRQTDRHVFIWGLIQRKYIDYNSK